MRAVLDDAAQLLRAGVQFYGIIGHVEGRELVVDAATEGFIGDGILAAGMRAPLEETLLGTVLRKVPASSHGDVRCYELSPEEMAHAKRPWQVAIGTPFHVERVRYFVGFALPQALEGGFNALDHTYVETIAVMCSARLRQRAQNERLQYHAEHDALTGLINGSTFRGRGLGALYAGRIFALAVVALDDFRIVNERVGHQTGDALLVEIAARLAQCAPPGDVVGRLSSDRFGIMIDGAKTRAEVEQRVRTYASAFGEPFGTGDRDGRERIALTASIGVAIASQYAAFPVVLAEAEAAVLEVKRGARGGWAFYNGQVKRDFASLRQMRDDLMRAIERDELVLHFQPHVEFTTARVAGAEALVRWNHPERGLLPPSEFVPFAEAHGLAHHLGAWVMLETIRVSERWRTADPNFTVWFNVSQPELLRPLLTPRLEKLPSGLLGLGVEITECAVLDNIDEMRESITMLRDAGFAIALDDFGTGYSSLAHLRRLPIDVVKIDRSFIAGVPHDEHDVAIVDAVMSISRRYGFATVAEGVESMEHAAFLAASGCRYGQGYFYARPMPADEFERWMRQRQARSG